MEDVFRGLANAHVGNSARRKGSGSGRLGSQVASRHPAWVVGYEHLDYGVGTRIIKCLYHRAGIQ